MYPLIVLLLAALPAQARWQRVESASFVVYAQRSPADARALAVQLQGFDQLLRQLWHIDAPPAATKVSVYFVENDAAFDQLARGARFDGFYTATPATIAAFVRRSPRVNGTRALHTMFHEYAHHFMFAHLPGSYPAWYVEGVAGYLETARFEARGTVYGDYGYGRMKSLVLQSWMPMARVLGSDWSGIPDYEMPLFYAQSWLAVHYMARDPVRAAQLARYLADVAAGTPADKAFPAAFGLPIEQLDGLLIKYAGAPELTQTRLDWLPPPPALVQTELPDVADDLLLGAANLAIGVAPQQAAALLARVRKAAARTPHERYAQTVLAEAELRLGDPHTALAQITALRDSAPDDAQLLYLHGLALVMQHQPAADVLTRGLETHPDDYRLRFLRGFAGAGLGDAQARADIRRANQLAPQVQPIAVAAAQVDLAQGDVKAARRLLQQVASDPHGGPMAARAATMLAGLPPI